MKRKLNKTIEANLLKSSLWFNNLKPDIDEQKVFFAIRNDKIGLYHKGGLLFSFDKFGFKTHIKYAAVIESNGNDYLTETELSQTKLSTNFESSYLRIMENCSNYAGIEASGVSEIYHRHSYISNENIVVLDIEVSFKSDNHEKKQDRIDIVLFNKLTNTLQFVEAKHYSNKEIWSNSTPKVINQIKRYEAQLKNKESVILSEYDNYIKSINNIFNLGLQTPIKIDPKVTLLIFGFDRDQLNGRAKTLIKNKIEFKDVKIYLIGNISKINIKALWDV